MGRETIIIFDFGGYQSFLLARRVRELGVYCEIYPSDKEKASLKGTNVKGIILAGNPGAGLDDNAMISDIDGGIFEFGAPVLLAGAYACKLRDTYSGSSIMLMYNMPDSFEDGDMLTKFVADVCHCARDWTICDFISQQVDYIRGRVGDKKALLALSGGVDSSVAAAIMSKAIGNQLVCVFVDHGFMRKNEGDEIERVFKNMLGINLIRLNCEERFLSRLDGISEPEEKRKAIGEEFIRVFEEEARKLGTIDFLVQGTIYPDIVESGTKTSGLIKSHHNVGGLPDVIDFKEIIEPLKDLFKDEVRKVGRALGLPDYLVDRQPFPGPGLAVRIIGSLTKEKLDVLRDADAIYREEIERAGLNREIWQYFAVLTGLQSVGVKNDVRSYGYTVALRAVVSVDAMSGTWARIPYELLARISERIVNETKDVNRVVYDITDKPPSTIEWE